MSSFSDIPEDTVKYIDGVKFIMRNGMFERVKSLTSVNEGVSRRSKRIDDDIRNIMGV